jgi:biotin synthase
MRVVPENELQAFVEMPLEQLIAEANDVRKEHIGTKLDLCSILNARCGLCGEDCKFCAQSARHNSQISAYPLKSTEEIIEAAQQAKNIGAERFGIVTSGNRLSAKELKVIAEAIPQIKEKIGITVCASLGTLTKDQLKLLKNAGLRRYHHNIETSRRFYLQIVSTHTFEERINTIKAAKQAGLEVCSGGIIGMGETWQDRIDMAYTLKELDVDSVPINVLIPIKGTPLESVEPISVEDVIRTICIFRIILEDKTIKVAAGREATLKDSQIKAFAAGANGMLIGGYLTVKGASLEDDYVFILEIEKLWTQ